MISICSATSVSPRESLERATSTCSRMALSGFLTSWATPLEMRLMAERRSAVCSSRPILRCASGSRRRTRRPLPAPGPPGRLSRMSTESSTTAGPGSVWPAHGEGNAPVADGAAGLRGLRHQQAERGGGRKDLGHRLPGKIGALAAEKFLDGAGGEDQAEFAIENEDGVLQVLQQVVDVAAQVGDFVLRAAQALAEQIDLGGHHRELVGGGLVGGQDFGLVFAAGHPIEHVADVAQRAEQRPWRTETSAGRRRPRRESPLPPSDTACP